MDKFELLYKGIKNKNKEVLINDSFNEDDLNTLLKRYPKLLALISGITYTDYGSYVNVELEYNKPLVNYDDVFVVNNKLELSNILNFFIQRFEDNITLVVTPGEGMFREYFKNDITHLMGKHPYCKEIGTKNAYNYDVGDATYLVSFLYIDYHVSSSTLKAVDAKIEEEVTRISKLLFRPDMPKEVKILLAHNYLVYNAEYDERYIDNSEAFDPYSQSAYGVLIKKVGVCQGFADAFKRILMRAGIWCEMVLGGVDSDTINHAWNIVRLDDGNCYHIDVTHDDSGKVSYFEYFLVSDEYMSSTRTWDRSIYPSCHGNRDFKTIIHNYLDSRKGKLLVSGIPILILNDDF